MKKLSTYDRRRRGQRQWAVTARMRAATEHRGAAPVRGGRRVRVARRWRSRTWRLSATAARPPEERASRWHAGGAVLFGAPRARARAPCVDVGVGRRRRADRACLDDGGALRSQPRGRGSSRAEERERERERERESLRVVSPFSPAFAPARRREGDARPADPAAQDDCCLPQWYMFRFVI